MIYWLTGIMLQLKQRLIDLESLLELDYGKLNEFEYELSVTGSPNVRNEAKQRIKREIMPSLRKHEAEYWGLIRQFSQGCTITEIDAQAAITTVPQDIQRIQPHAMPSEVLELLQQILDKLNEPGTAAAAKAKFVVNLIPGVLAYEFELDTENALRRAFQPFKDVFGAAAKK
jgi:hypothetical protein